MDLHKITDLLRADLNLISNKRNKPESLLTICHYFT